MLYIRADGNAEIGTGHVMRCLAIAKAARSMGQNCTFITADEEMIPLLSEQDFPSICLHSVWNDLDRETPQMEALIRERNISCLLVDSYFVTPDYLSRLHRLTHVAYMDDLNLFHYPCSTLINYQLYVEGWDYPEQYPDTRLLLGPKYAPLREEFQNLPRRMVREQVRDVLITTGGSDPLNIAGQLVRRAKQMPEMAAVTYHIVAGRFNQHLTMLEQLAEVYPGVVIHRNVQKMSELMMACDIAVSAGGSTLYELAACGTPTVCFAMADNQLEGIAAFGRDHMISAGDAIPDQDGVIECILRQLEIVSGEYEARIEQSVRLRALVDGGGAGRIAENIWQTDKGIRRCREAPWVGGGIWKRRRLPFMVPVEQVKSYLANFRRGMK